MDRDQLLREKTHKQDGLEVGRRVFYTLTEGTTARSQTPDAYRTSKLLSLLIEHLAASGKLSEEDIDRLLLEVAV